MNVQFEPLVSVVTPFYNTSEYLSECIESVISQTYQNWEYILVDNCSTDGSVEIAKNYALKDKRIRVVQNKKFLTQIQNYNVSVKEISINSVYCKIVQADDWMFPECLSRMVFIAEKDASIGIVAGYRLQGKKITNDGLVYTNDVILGKDVCRINLLIDGSQIFGSPTTVLMRSAIVRSFDELYSDKNYFEDSDICFDILKDWNFGFVFQVIAFERVNDESLSSEISSFDPSWILAKFIRIKKYGDYFLGKEEFEKRFENVRDAYFAYLGHNVFCMRGKDFWAYHRNGLATVGYDLKLSTLGKYIIMEIIGILFNPKTTLGIIFRWCKRKN